MRTFPRASLNDAPGECYEADATPGCPHPTQEIENLLSYPCIQTFPKMSKKPNKKTFLLNALIDGHIISGTVALSPAPQPGIFTELARFEAERVLAHAVREAIAAGRL